MSSEATLTIKVNGKSAERDIKRLGTQLDRLEKEGTKVERQLGALGKKAKILAATGLAALGVALIKSTELAVDFEKSMAEISTLMDGDITQSMSELTEGVRKLSTEYGGDIAANSKALYSIISAGASDSAEAMGILDAANQLAIGGVTDVATAADGLTSALNAYGAEADEAESYSDAMFVAMKAGKTTIKELSDAMGTVAPMSAQLGVEFNELQAALAALTTTGLGTAEAATQLQAVLSNVLKPSSLARKEAARLGLEFNSTAIETKGLAGFLADLKEKTGGSKDSLGQLFKSSEAVKLVLSLTGAQAEVFNDTLAAMDEKAGATAAAFEKMKDTVSFEWGRFTAHMKDWGITLGTLVLPPLKEVLSVLNDLLDRMAGDTAIEATARQINALSESALDAVNDMAKLRAEYAKGEIEQEKYDEIMRRLENTYTSLKNKISELKGEQKGLTDEFKLTAEQAKTLDNDLNDLFKSEGDLFSVTNKVGKSLAKQTKATKDKTKYTDDLSDSVLDMYDAEMDALDATSDFKDAMDDSIKVMKLRAEGSELAALQEEAWIEMEKKSILISREQSDAYVQQAYDLQALANATKTEVGAMGQIWDNFIENTQRAFGDLIYTNMKSVMEDGKLSFKDFTDTLLDMFLRMIAEMVAKWAAVKLVNWFSGSGGIVSGITSYFGAANTAVQASGGLSSAIGGVGTAAAAAKGIYASYSASLANGATAAQAAVAAYETASAGAGVTVYALGEETAIVGTKLTELAKGAEAANTSIQGVNASSNTGTAAMSANTAAAGAFVLALAGISYMGYKAAKARDEENARLTDQFNTLKTQTNEFDGELIQLTDTMQIVGTAGDTMFLHLSGDYEARRAEMDLYKEALIETGATVKNIYSQGQDAVTMVTGSMEQLAAATDVLEAGFDNAKVTMTSFMLEGMRGSSRLTASIIGDTKEWEKVLNKALASGELSADSSFGFIEDEFGNMVLNMRGDAELWAKYLGEQGRIGANSMAESFQWLDSEGEAMYASLSQETMSFQLLMNSLTAPELTGTVNWNVSPPPGSTTEVAPRGFATGGSFVVGGSGGMDTTPVGFMATKGETVTVETKEQRESGGDSQLIEAVNSLVEIASEQLDMLAKTVTASEAHNEMVEAGIRL